MEYASSHTFLPLGVDYMSVCPLSTGSLSPNLQKQMAEIYKMFGLSGCWWLEHEFSHKAM